MTDSYWNELQGLRNIVESTQPNPGIFSAEKATSQGELTLEDFLKAWKTMVNQEPRPRSDYR